MLAAFATEAVIIFFVLSGLVITRSVLRTAPTASVFLCERLVRIYPIYMIALSLAIVTAWVLRDPSQSRSTWVGNLFFLQSLNGALFPAPSTDQPLWSLANEMTYYVIFAACIAKGFLKYLFWIAAIISAVIVSFVVPSGVAGHLVVVMSLALPWLFGSLVAGDHGFLPRFSVASGVCFLMIGLMFARSPLSGNFYDPFRLCAFGLLSTPLLSALSTNGDEETGSYVLARAIAFGVGAALLWTISPALFVTKAFLTAVGLAAVIIPLSVVDAVLRRIAFLRRPLTYVGSISYALYAIHVPILLLIRHVTPDNPFLRLALFLPSIFLVAHLLERRLQPCAAATLLRRKRSPERGEA